MMDFALKMMGFVLQTMEFVLKLMDFVFKMMDFVFKMMDFKGDAEGWCEETLGGATWVTMMNRFIKHEELCIKNEELRI